MNLTYDQLSEDSQGEAIAQVNERHPIETRIRGIHQLIFDYEYNEFGEIMEDEPERLREYDREGQDPEYYDDMLND